MKKLLVIIIPVLLINISSLKGQTIEINGSTGYQLGGKARLYEGDFKIDNSQNYGGKIAVGVIPDMQIEISYIRADTRGRFFPFNGDVSEYADFSSNYIQVAGLQQMDLGPINPFFTVGMGMVVWSPKTSVLETKTQFSASLGAGIKYWLNESIGIRIQSTLLMPMIYNGFGFGCGIGTGGAGCGSNLYTRVTPIQGEFSGGLAFRISK